MEKLCKPGGHCFFVLQDCCKTVATHPSWEDITENKNLRTISNQRCSPVQKARSIYHDGTPALRSSKPWCLQNDHSIDPSCHGRAKVDTVTHWLVVDLPLWKILYSQLGYDYPVIPNIWKNKKCSKPPTRLYTVQSSRPNEQRSMVGSQPLQKCSATACSNSSWYTPHLRQPGQSKMLPQRLRENNQTSWFATSHP